MLSGGGPYDDMSLFLWSITSRNPTRPDRPVWSFGGHPVFSRDSSDSSAEVCRRCKGASPVAAAAVAAAAVFGGAMFLPSVWS